MKNHLKSLRDQIKSETILQWFDRNVVRCFISLDRFRRQHGFILRCMVDDGWMASIYGLKTDSGYERMLSFNEEIKTTIFLLRSCLGSCNNRHQKHCSKTDFVEVILERCTRGRLTHSGKCLIIGQNHVFVTSVLR